VSRIEHARPTETHHAAFVTTLDSLHYVLSAYVRGNFLRVFYLDESRNATDHKLHSKTLGVPLQRGVQDNKRAACLTASVDTPAASHRVFCGDADLGIETRLWLTEVVLHKTAKTVHWHDIKHTATQALPGTVRVYKHERRLLERTLDQLRAGRRVMVFFASRTKLLEWQLYFVTHYFNGTADDPRLFALHSGTNENLKAHALGDINAFLRATQCQLMLFTTTGSTGIDIKGHFDVIHGVLAEFLEPTALVQALFREREPRIGRFVIRICFKTGRRRGRRHTKKNEEDEEEEDDEEQEEEEEDDEDTIIDDTPPISFRTVDDVLRDEITAVGQQSASYEAIRRQMTSQVYEGPLLKHASSAPYVLGVLQRAIKQYCLEHCNAIMMQLLRDKGLRITVDESDVVDADIEKTIKQNSTDHRAAMWSDALHELSQQLANEYMASQLLGAYGNAAPTVAAPNIPTVLVARLYMIDKHTPHLMWRIHAYVNAECAGDVGSVTAGIGIASHVAFDRNQPQDAAELRQHQHDARILANLARLVSSAADAAAALLVPDGTQWLSTVSSRNKTPKPLNDAAGAAWLLDPAADNPIASRKLTTREFLAYLERGAGAGVANRHLHKEAKKKLAQASRMTHQNVVSLMRSLANSFFDVDYIATPTTGRTKLPTAYKSSIEPLMHIYLAWAQRHSLPVPQQFRDWLGGANPWLALTGEPPNIATNPDNLRVILEGDFELLHGKHQSMLKDEWAAWQRRTSLTSQ
jgi:hypothetical protein